MALSMTARGCRWYQAAGLAAIAAALVGLPACSSSCDEDVIDRGVAFLDAHQSCATDADCVVVSDHCGELPGGFCGQLAMNRDGAESPAWKAFERELQDCAPDSCSVCAAALVPSCNAGSCRGAQ